MKKRAIFLILPLIYGFNGCVSQNYEKTYSQNTFEARNKTKYYELTDIISKKGFRIDEEKSKFFENSKIVVFIPDIHTNELQEINLCYLQKLTKAFSFDSFGLEGLVGEINETKKKNLIEKLKNYEWKKKSEEKDEKIDFTNLELLEEEKTRIEEILRANNYFHRMHRDYDDFFLSVSPGMKYLDTIPKNARVYGLEEEKTFDCTKKLTLIQFAHDLIGLNLKIKSYLRKKIDEEHLNKESYIKIEKTLDEHIKKISEIEKFNRRELGFNFELSDNIINLFYYALVADIRTEKWAENISNFEGESILVIGGLGHAPYMHKELSKRKISHIIVNSEHLLKHHNTN